MKLTRIVLPSLGLGLAGAIQQPLPIQPRQAPDPQELYAPYNISVPIDHFQNDSSYEPHSDGMFNLTYYFDASHYRKGGPVIVLNGGETAVVGRLPYLQKGIVAQLAEATGGIGVILEHRYYGTSFPVPDLSTENMRFLTTEQALADQAYFAQHVVFEGLEDLDLTAPGTPYITYGGSYAGAFVAFMRIQYPDLYWGAISSSGVTEAIYDFWQYYEAVRNYAPSDCVDTQGKLMSIVDGILMGGNNESIDALKNAVNASSLIYNDDFAYLLSQGIGSWQSLNWDPEMSSNAFFEYCGNITSDEVQYPDADVTASQVSDLINAAGYGDLASNMTNRMLNFLGYTKTEIVDSCTSSSTLDSCYGWHNASSARYSDRSYDNQNSLSWQYQVCTEWGFYQSGSTVPENLPALISRGVTLEWNLLPCELAFNLSGKPDVDRVNKYGGFNISYPRLAIIGGEADPWRAASPLATLDVPDRLNDTSTISEPIILIGGKAVHHWDENGLFPNETTPELPPGPVRDAQAQLAQSVQAWMAEWYLQCMTEPGSCKN